MDLRLVAYAPNGANLGVLPAPSGFSGSLVLADVGALTLDYAADAPRADLLAGACEVAMEYVTSEEITDETSDYTDIYTDTYPAVTTVTVTPAGAWTEPLDCRFVVLRDSGDEVKRPGIVSYEAPGYAWRLSKAGVRPGGPPRPDGKRAFLNATPGTILLTLINEAVARGALAGMDFTGFTTTLDSNGAAWTHQLAIYYTPGIDLLKVLRNLAEQGMCDFAFAGRALKVWNPDGIRARDLTAAASQVELIRARDLKEAPFSGTREGIASDVFIQGEGGTSLALNNPEAETPWGPWEDFISHGGVSDTGTMTALAQATLNRSERRREQRTYGLAFDKARHLPFRDYVCGDYVWARTGGTAVKVRVRQLTLGRTTTGVVTGSAVLNDRFLEADVRLSRRIEGITNGASSGGTGEVVEPPDPSTGDTMPPAQVTGVNTTSTAYIDPAGNAQAQVTVGWGIVTLNADGTAADDIAAYEVWRRHNLSGHAWHLMTVVEAPDLTVDSSPYDPASSWQFRVRAVDRAGNFGVFSLTVTRTMAVDATPPAPPSIPILSARLGTITVRWDGKNDVGGDPPLDLSHIEVHVSLSSGFTPSLFTLSGRLNAGPDLLVITGLTYNTVRHVKLRAVDTSGNISLPSAQASASVTPLVNTDVIGEIISGANIVDGSIVAADKITGNTITGQLIQSFAIETGHLAANAITADKIEAGAVTAAAIAAGAVSAEKVKIGSLPPTVFTSGVLGTNLIPDPGLEDATWRADRLALNAALRPGSTLAFSNTALLGNTTWRAQLVARGPATPTALSPLLRLVTDMPITAERKIYGGFRCAKDSASTTGDLMLKATIKLSDGTLVPLVIADTTDLAMDNTMWYQAMDTAAVPANAVSANIYIEGMSTWTAGTWSVDDIEVREVLGAAGYDRRVEISPVGFFAYDPAPGELVTEQEPVISLGTGTDDFLVLTDQGHQTVASISRDGFGSFTDGSFRDWPSVLGRGLDGHIDDRPGGIMEWANGQGNSVATATELGFFELASFVKPGRMYRVSTNAIRVMSNGSGLYGAGIRLRYSESTAGGTNTAPQPLVTSAMIAEGQASNFEGAIGATVTISQTVWFAAATHVRILVSVYKAYGTGNAYILGNFVGNAVQCFLEDIGHYKPASFKLNSGAGDGPSVIPTGVSGTFDRSFGASWSQTFRGDGSLRTDTEDAVQGYHVSNGDQGAIIGFPNLVPELTGASIASVEVYLYALHWHYNSGGTAVIGSHSNITAPGAWVNVTPDRLHSTGWPKPGGRWVDITGWAAPGLQAGTVRGVTLGRAGTPDATLYGRFAANGHPQEPVLRVRYTK